MIAAGKKNQVFVLISDCCRPCCYVALCSKSIIIPDKVFTFFFFFLFFFFNKFDMSRPNPAPLFLGSQK